MGAGEALRRVLECLASGILMSGMNVGKLDISICYLIEFYAVSFHLTCYACFLSESKTILSMCFRWCWNLWSMWKRGHRCYWSLGSPAERRHHSQCTSEYDKIMCWCVCIHNLVKMKPTPCFLYVQHALRLSAFGQLHKVLGMDPLPSKMPKKPRSETPIDYTGKPSSHLWDSSNQQSSQLSLVISLKVFLYNAARCLVF